MTSDGWAGTVEFVAAQEYMVRPPQPPVYLFVIEATYASVSSGMLRCVSATLLHTIERLPGVAEGRTQVGLITFDSTLHFYNLSASSPQMLVGVDGAHGVAPIIRDTGKPIQSRDGIVGQACASQTQTSFASRSGLP